MTDYLYYCRDIRKELLKLDKNIDVGNHFMIPIKNERLSVHGLHERSFFQVQYALQNTLRNYSVTTSNSQIKVTKKFVDRTYGKRGDLGVLLVTNGKTNLNRLLTCVLSDNTISKKIYVCGPDHIRSVLPKNCSFIADDGLNLSQKKLRLIEMSVEETLLILHDHVVLKKNFFKYLPLTGTWDVYSCKRLSSDSLDQEIEGHGSFINYDGNVEGISWKPKNRSFNGDIDYSSIFINGGFMCLRRSILHYVTWPEHLGWGAMEDLHLSRELVLNGACFYYDDQNSFYASSKRLGKRRPLLRKISFLKKLKYLWFIVMNLKRYHRLKFDD